MTQLAAPASLHTLICISAWRFCSLLHRCIDLYQRLEILQASHLGLLHRYIDLYARLEILQPRILQPGVTILQPGIAILICMRAWRRYFDLYEGLASICSLASLILICMRAWRRYSLQPAIAAIAASCSLASSSIVKRPLALNFVGAQPLSGKKRLSLQRVSI